MGASGTARFRVIVLLLLVLIVWQAYKLYPRNPSAGENVCIIYYLFISYFVLPSVLNVILSFSFQNGISDQVLLPEKIVEVSVFYEALCPDSRHFFVHHLDTTFKKLKDNISLKLIPYGKAKVRYSIICFKIVFIFQTISR